MLKISGNGWRKLTGRKKVIIISAGIFSGLFLTISVVFFFHAGTWLLYQDKPPDRLDVIFTFSENSLRDAYSHNLAKQYSSAVRIISASDWRLNGTGKDKYFRKFIDGPADSARTIYNDSLMNTFRDRKSVV
jgi:hypothetical protein